MGLMDLFRPARKQPGEETRVKAVESLHDQAVLAQMAMTDPSPRVRRAAGYRLTDAGRLAEVGRHICARRRGHDWEKADLDVLEHVAKQTDDLRLLEEIAEAGDYTAGNRLQLARLVAAVRERSALPPELIEELTCSDASVRARTVARLTDQPTLEEFARLETESSVLEAVAERLASQDALAGLARRETWNSVRAAAVSRLSDSTVLREILRDDADPRVRPAAVARLMELGDQEGLAAGATTLEGDAACRAAWALRDPELLARVAEEARSGEARRAARKRLEGGDSLPAHWMPLALKVGEAVDISTRGCEGLPWDASPDAAGGAWQPIIPGTYVLAKIEGGWAYLRSGGTMLKLDADDLQMYGMAQGWIR